VAGPERRRPVLEPSAIAAILASEYGIEPVAVVPETSGHDAVTRAFRVATADSERAYFLKARPADSRLDVAGRIAAHLRDQGLREIVAPIATRDGSLAVRAGDVSLALFPFVEGRRAMEVGLRDADWEHLGRFARSLHEATLPAELRAVIPQEAFRIQEVEAFARVDAAAEAAEATQGTPEAREVVAAWRRHRNVVAETVERTVTLGREVAPRGLPFVTCHADLHTGNVLVDAAGELWVFDWDEVVAAPKERDLMFFIGGISHRMVGERATTSFLRGYGETSVDPVALSYYRHAWATQDVVGYAEQVLVEASRSDEDRAEAARIFPILFRPGEIVDIARSTKV
jgi:spectinomycin phosphotransferase